MSALLSRLRTLTSKRLCLLFKSQRPSGRPPSHHPAKMEINSTNFSSEVIKIIQNIAASRFIAFDLEFSGVASRRNGGGGGRLSIQDYYSDLRSAAQIYQILQVGLTVVTEDVENGRYEARPYNINLNPLPATKESVFTRVWSYNSGATSFLLRNGFDMSKPLIEGVHYLSRQEADQMRQKLIQDEELRSKIPDMQLSGDDDHLVNHIVDLVGNWQSQPKKDQQSYLNIPAEDAKDPVPAVLNRYQVRLVHQIIRNQYPGLKSQGMGQFVQITNPRSEAQVDEKADREKRRELEISNAIGLRWVWEAIMGGDISKLPHHYVVAGHTSDDCPKDIQAFLNSLQKNLRSQSRALVGHNCMTDLVNLYRCFIGDLPLTVGEFSAKLQELFPIVIDTKYIAGLGQNRHLDTSLQSVETDLAPNALPRIHLPSMFDKYLYSSVYHEAGFDSWVTAKIGLKLPLKLKRGGQDIKAMVRKTLPCSPEDDSVVEIERKNVSPSQEALSHEKPGTGIANSIVGIISNPVTVVKSLLTGVSQPVSERPAATTKPKSTLLPATVMPTTGAVVAAKEKAQTSTIEKDELKKLKDISKKSNIYDMLEDEPEDASIESAEKDEEERINELLKAGMLLPRWEKDAEFWKLISNKLQANATQEGILDLTRR